ncbi:MAG: oxygen-independent coproporphyrinogen III oxidase [Bdellovibrionia bacterium]
MSTELNLLRKYNVPGPRYTSYPTVPYWSESPTQQQWIQSISQALEESEKQNVGAALYVHIPFCESLCTYCGCNTRITRNRDVSASYTQTVLKEWSLYLEKLRSIRSQDITISEIHLGGGTPTFLHPRELERLLLGILDQARIPASAEFSVEADPRVTEREHLQVLSKLGFKRLSLGIQDFDPHVQQIVHRVQSEEQVRRVTQEARDLGYTSINYDLIYGLPFQTQTSVRKTIEAVQRLRPDRIAFYAYAHVPWIKPSQRRFTEADLPEAGEKRALYELGRQMLEEVGYQEIGMDHFALKNDSLWKASLEGSLHRNFMGYTTRQVSPLIGLGVSAIGDSWSVFAQNEKVLETYSARVEKGEIPIFRGHVLNAEDQVMRRHILNLMTRLKTSWSEDSLRVDHLQTIQDRLAELCSDGLVELQQEACLIPERGRPFLRNICMAFDARLIRNAPQTEIFSRTI